jgi:hypothetical protein
MRTIRPLDLPVSLGLPRGRGVFPLALLLAAAFGGAQTSWTQAGGAQRPTATAAVAAHPLASTHTSASTHQPVPASKRRAGGKAAVKLQVKAQVKTQATAAQAAPAPVPVTPPAPELPKWPANEKAVQATVTWDSQGLRIEAANSSLEQILNDLEHFRKLCRPGLHWYPTHFRNKRGNGWGTGVYSKSENALDPPSNPP